MSGSINDSGSTAASKSFGIRLAVLLSLAAALTVGFVYQRTKAVPAEDGMRGDADEASGALATKLASMPAAGRVPTILKSADSPYPGLRAAAYEELRGVREPGVAEALERGYTDSSSLARQRVLEVLPSVDNDRARRLLLSALRDEDSWLREAAIRQLSVAKSGKLITATRDVVPGLIRALDDTDETVPFMAMNLLRKLTGKPWRVKIGSSAAERVDAIANWKRWSKASAWPVPAEYADAPAIRPTRSDPSPDFSFVDIDGRRASLSGQKGRVTLLNFWGTWCPPCQQEIPDLIRLDETYRDKGLDIIGIAVGETGGANGLRDWCRNHNVGYRQAIAVPEVQTAFGHVDEVPVSVLIDQQGRVRYWWEAERDFNTFRAAVDRLLWHDRK